MGFLSNMFDLTPTGYVANKIGEAIGPQVVSATNQAADIEAINKFFAETPPANNEAAKVKTDWVAWYNKLGWYDKNVVSGTGNEAINRRNAYLRANATTNAEQKMVDDFLKGGPAVNPVTGQVIQKTPEGDRYVPKPPLIPTPYKVAAVATIAGVTTLVVLKKLYII